MFTKSFPIILFISFLISCDNQKDRSTDTYDIILNLADSLDIPSDTVALIFISPNSKCLYCDKKMYFISDTNKHNKIYIISTFEKNRLFNLANSSMKCKQIEKNKYYQIFTKKLSEFSRLVLIRNHSIQGVYLITPKNSDTIVNFLSKNF